MNSILLLATFALSVINFGDNFSTRRVIAWAKKSALLRCPIEGAKLSWIDKINKSEHEVVLRILATHFGSSKKRSRKTEKQ